MSKNIDKIVLSAINEQLEKTLGGEKVKVTNEAYAIQSRSFKNQTEKLSDKTKKSHQELLEGYVDIANKVSIKLDSVDRDNSNLNHSNYRSLKLDETYNLNAAFLHGLYFENIGDMNSKITTDSLTFMRLERDFGSFDNWQKDFIASCLSARNGWAITYYNIYLKKYVNTIIDLHDLHVPIGCVPVIVMDVWEHAYYHDYLKDRKLYVFSMMKEINWQKIEERIEKTEMLGRVM
jgi:Fe-Mn family superoxide dismutase